MIREALEWQHKIALSGLLVRPCKLTNKMLAEEAQREKRQAIHQYALKNGASHEELSQIMEEYS